MKYTIGTLVIITLSILFALFAIPVGIFGYLMKKCEGGCNWVEGSL